MKRNLWLSAVLVGVVALLVLPAGMASAAGLIDITSGPGCQLKVTFTVAAGDPTGDYLVRIWDDGVVVTASKVNVAGAGTYSITLLVPNPSDLLVPGLGVYLYDPTNDFNPVDKVETYSPTGLDPACGAGPDMVPLPPQAVVGAVKTDTPTYWAPSADAKTDVTLSAGKTVWVLGVDASGRYYKIVLAGQYLWVPKAALGPNYDAVWNGAPLPTTVVE